MTYRADYPKKSLGGTSPYYCCALCGVSDSQINGQISKHLPYCPWRKKQERARNHKEK